MASGWMRWPSMLYRITSGPRASGWANDEGGARNLEAVTFLPSRPHRAVSALPGALSIPKESTTWPDGETQPTHLGGLDST